MFLCPNERTTITFILTFVYLGWSSCLYSAASCCTIFFCTNISLWGIIANFWEIGFR